MTLAERQELAARAKAENQRRAAEREEVYARVADKAKSIWKAASPASGHPYAKRKGVSDEGLKVDRHGNLLIPAYGPDGKISTIQMIPPTEDGAKFFLKDGRKDGCYYPIGAKGESKARIILCEGWATGRALRDATGLPVVVCFDAGNILPVALLLREKYPDAEFIFAADNDQWTMKAKVKAERFRDLDLKELPGNDPRWADWRAKGFLENPGVEAAASAANRVGGRVTFPFRGGSFQHPGRPSDFNDLLVMEGVDAVKAAFLRGMVQEAFNRKAEGDQPPSEPTPPKPPPARDGPPGGRGGAEGGAKPVNGNHAKAGNVTGFPAPRLKKKRSQDWKAGLVTMDDMTTPKPKSLKNLDLFMQNHEDFAGVFVYDEFARQIVVHRCPPWEDGETFQVHRYGETDLTRCQIHLESFGLKPSKEAVHDVIVSTARLVSVNPAREYFDGLKWDRVPRLDHWLTYYLGADTQPPEYLSMVGPKWLMGAVSRVYEPGAKFDYMLILEGRQGLMKSTALAVLATFNGVSYHTDDAKDISNKDTLMVMQGKLVVEMAELQAWGRSGLNDLKAFVTRRTDEFRAPYGRVVEAFPRQCVFAGTVNPEGPYFKDITGNRRFWPVMCRSIDLDALRRDREQLWAEAVWRLRQGERTWLTAAEEDLAVSQQQRERLQEDPWTEPVTRLLENEYPATMTEVLQGLGLDMSKRDHKASGRVNQIAAALGYEYRSTRAKTGQVHKAFLRRDPKNEPLPKDD